MLLTTHDTITRNDIYVIMAELEFLAILIRLTKVTMTNV
jgi:hypothetical protein